MPIIHASLEGAGVDSPKPFGTFRTLAHKLILHMQSGEMALKESIMGRALNEL